MSGGSDILLVRQRSQDVFKSVSSTEVLYPHLCDIIGVLELKTTRNMTENRVQWSWVTKRPHFPYHMAMIGAKNA